MLSKFTVSLMVAAASAQTAFRYDSNGGTWGSIYPLCGSGKEQSPINLYKWMTDADSNQKIEGFNFRNYGAGGLEIEKTPNTMKMEFSEGKLNLTLPPADENSNPSSSNFYPTDLVFHAPSEHTVNGYHYDLEMQINFTYQDASLGSVLSIFFDVEKGGWGLTEATRKPDDWAAAAVGTKTNDFIE